ncbi:ABC transporter ATP-binding protein [Brachybacterium sp. AOP42-E1-35]|uniref:ABC transporter ATP-binding protein n=1 Tax=Brachybacterium sp. AOP42-E1-35 TaxID=3457664 RepID=UPI00402ACB08
MTTFIDREPDAAVPAQAELVLDVQDLSVRYRSRRSWTTVLQDVDLSIASGESVVLAGESGCGKTTLAMAALALLPKNGETIGSITLTRKSGLQVRIDELDAKELRPLRWTEMAVVYQGAMNSLNPLLTIEDHFVETAAAHPGAMPRQDVREWSRELLELVMLDAERVLTSYPHQLSGGMRQRVNIALALLLKPRLLVLDEPTTALDVITQRTIIEILRSLQRDLGFAMVFITHDLALASELADRVAVMYKGRIAEMGTVQEIFGSPQHPYTKALLAAIPRWDDEPGTLASITEVMRQLADEEAAAGAQPAQTSETDQEARA